MTKASHRYWLTFPTERTRRPLIWEMSKKFDMVFNIRSANITHNVGILALELTGTQDNIEEAVDWLRRRGVEVDSIELDVLEG